MPARGLAIGRQIVACLRQPVLPKPRNGRVTNAEQLGDLNQRLTSSTTTQSLFGSVIELINAAFCVNNF
jgi:hypothetical protein